MPSKKLPKDISIGDGIDFDYNQALYLIGKTIKGVHATGHSLILVFDDKSSLTIVGKRADRPLGIEFVNSKKGKKYE